MQSLIERAAMNEKSDVEELRELAVEISVDGNEPTPRIMCDGGRPTAGWRSPLGGPQYDGPIPGDGDGRVDEWRETEAERELEQRRIAEAVAGPEPRDGEAEDDVLRADGGEVEDRGPLHVGDQVTTDGDASMVVMRVCSESAGEYYIDKFDESVAEYNGCDPSEAVYQVVFADRTDKDLADNTRYPYPRSRLELVAPVHDRDDQEEGE